MKKALRINTDFTTELLDLSSDEYNKLSGAVGGLIQAVDLKSDLTIWLNEEGKLLDLPVNLVATRMWDRSFGVGTDVLVGDCVFTGGTDEDGETLELSRPWITQLKIFADRLRKAYEGTVTVY